MPQIIEERVPLAPPESSLAMRPQPQLWPSQHPSAETQDDDGTHPGLTPSARPVSPSMLASPPPAARDTCRKTLKGQFLSGTHSVYDVDKQLPSDSSQNLEVLPISVYGWDPALVAGRQIAVNRRYICYCLRPGSIRILSRNVVAWGLFQGHSQKVTDITFFGESVHLVASASSDGRIFVWRISEDLGVDGKCQLSELILLGIQFEGEWKDVHPCMCWHPHSQDCLLVCISKYILKLDLNEIRLKAASVRFSADSFINCHITNLMSGVQLIGTHDNDVTDISVLSRDILCIASASKDGTVRVWQDGMINPVAVFMPHDGQPVASIAFISAPHQADEAVLLSGGPSNHSLKLWVPSKSKKSFDCSMWCSVQTLELKSSSQGNADEVFCNQLCVVPESGIILLGNSKKHAMYSIHLNISKSICATRMDYLAEFTMSMPILSLTAMADIGVNFKGIIQVFCVQTQAIQEYFMNVSFCLPPCLAESHILPSTSALNGVDLCKRLISNDVELKEDPSHKGNESSLDGRDDSGSGVPSVLPEHNLISDSGSGFGSWVEVPNWVAATLKKAVKIGSTKEAPDLVGARCLSPLASVSEGSVSADQGTMASSCDTSEISVVNLSSQPLSSGEEEKELNLSGRGPSRVTTVVGSKNSQLIFPPAFHDMACFERDANTADKVNVRAGQEVTLSVKNKENAGEESGALVKQGMICATSGEQEERESEVRHCIISSSEELGVDNENTLMISKEQMLSRLLEGGGISKALPDQFIKEGADVSKHPETVLSANNSKKKNRNKNRDNNAVATVAPVLYHTTQMQASSFEDTNQAFKCKIEDNVKHSGLAFGNLVEQMTLMQKSADQLLVSYKELERHVSESVVSRLSIETRRMDTVFGQGLGRCLKDSMVSFWNDFDSKVKTMEAFQQECFHQLMAVVTNSFDKAAVTLFHHVLKTQAPLFESKICELSSLYSDASISTVLVQNLEIYHEKNVKGLEKLLIEWMDVAITQQVKADLLASGNQSMQDVICAYVQEQAFLALQKYLNNMSEQAWLLVDQILGALTFEEQHHLSTSLSLALNLKEKLVSLSSTIASLKENVQEIEGQLHESIEHKFSVSHSDKSISITVELTRLLQQGHFEEAFALALSVGSSDVISWICKQVDPKVLFASRRPPLSQGVLVALLQQLGSLDFNFGVSNDVLDKLLWMEQAILAMDPTYMRPLLENLYVNLQRRFLSPSATTTNNKIIANQARLIIHILNSLLTSIATTTI